MCCGAFLLVQWLGLQASTAGGIGSILGQGTKILHATQPKKKSEERERTNRLSRALPPRLPSNLTQEAPSVPAQMTSPLFPFELPLCCMRAGQATNPMSLRLLSYEMRLLLSTWQVAGETELTHVSHLM